MNIIQKICKNMLDIIYPPRCPMCSTLINTGDDFCEDCHSKISFCNELYSIEECETCLSVCIYDENISNAVYTLKDRGGNAPYAFGKGMAELLLKFGIAEKIDVIVPVPMYKSDKRKRGYNQTELIAKEISHILNIGTNSKIVIKSQKTAHQKNLSVKERKVNLKDAFTVINSDIVKGKNVLLVDDVCTTGSTLSEISKILKQNEVNEVFCCTYCHTVNTTYRR